MPPRELEYVGRSQRDLTPSLSAALVVPASWQSTTRIRATRIAWSTQSIFRAWSMSSMPSRRNPRGSVKRPSRTWI